MTCIGQSEYVETKVALTKLEDHILRNVSTLTTNPRTLTTWASS